MKREIELLKAVLKLVNDVRAQTTNINDVSNLARAVGLIEGIILFKEISNDPSQEN